MNTEHTDTYTTNDHLNFPQSTAAATLNVPSEASAPRPVPSTVPFASASDTIGDVVRPPVESEDLTGTNVEYGTFDPNEGNDDRSQAGGGDEDKAGGDEGGGGRGHHANRGGRRGKGYASRGGFKKKQEGEQGKKGKDLGRTAYRYIIASLHP